MSNSSSTLMDVSSQPRTVSRGRARTSSSKSKRHHAPDGLEPQDITPHRVAGSVRPQGERGRAHVATIQGGRETTGRGTQPSCCTKKRQNATSAWNSGPSRFRRNGAVRVCETSNSALHAPPDFWVAILRSQKYLPGGYLKPTRVCRAVR